MTEKIKRDDNSEAIIIDDASSLANYRKARETRHKQQQRIDNLETELGSLKKLLQDRGII